MTNYLIKRNNSTFDALDDVFNSFFKPMFFEEKYNVMKTDIRESEKAYLMDVEIPGFEKKDIQLEISGDTLTVRAQRHSKLEEKDKKDKLIRIERSYGSYSRQFDISGVEAEQIKARYDNGVLKLTLPKKQAALPESRHLEIE